MVRTEYLHQQKKKPRGVSVPITLTQEEARNNMMETLLSNPPVEDNVFAQAVHQLCSSLLMASLVDAPQKGFAFELALCFYAHRLSLNASQVSQLFAGMQSCFRLTLAHVVRLRNQGGEVYTDPPKSLPPYQNTAPSFQSTDGDITLKNDQGVDITPGCEEWPDIGLDDELEASKGSSAQEISTGQGDESLIRFVPLPILFTQLIFLTSLIEKLNIWVEPRPERDGAKLDTPFSRLKSSWAQVNPEGFLVHGSWAGTWSPEGDYIQFSRIGKELQSLFLEDYRQNTLRLVRQLPTCLANLLPDGISLPQTSSQIFVDNPLESKSFLDLPKSQDFFLPLFKKFEEGMLRSQKGLAEANISETYQLDIGELKAWLKKEFKFQQLLLAALLTTGGGIPPRQLTIGDCRIRRTKSSERNIFIMGGSLTWAWGKEKGIGQKHGSLWSYPPQVAEVVYYYLGVIRPFTIKVLRKLGRSTLHLETHLFARPSDPDQTWSTSCTNESIKEHLSLPLNLTVGIHDLRQLGQAIMNRHFLPISQELSLSTINQMANHNNWTSDKHYGRDNTSNISLPNRPRLDITQMLSTSNTYHSWLGFTLAESHQEGLVAYQDFLSLTMLSPFT
jgi:hypothetical protein